MSDPLRSVRGATAQARSSWRRARAVDAAGLGLAAGLLGASVHAVGLELAAPGGLSPHHLGALALWAVPALVAGATRWSMAPSPAASAAELDARLGLADRIGTALEFAAADSALPLVTAQRADAAAAAATAHPAAVFAPAWGRIAPLVLGGLVLLLAVAGAALTFQWTPTPAPTALSTAADDLLAAIDRDRTERVELGDRQAVRLLNDLENRIRRITAREATVRKQLARRAPDPPPATTDDSLDLELPPPRPEKESTGISVEDLEALEEATLDQLALTDGMEAEIVSELFRETHAAQKLVEEFGHLDHTEMDATFESEDASRFGRETATDRAVQAAQNKDLLGSSQVGADSLVSTEDRVGDNIDMIRRDLSAESLGAHDRGHDTQESFNRFLKDFVKELQQVVAEKALGGKSRGKKQREVKTNAGEATADKRDAMQESGFEEMDGPKRSSGDAPPETVSGKGKPPKNAKMQQGQAGENAIAMKGKGEGGTSAGAKGAGTGAAGQEGLRALIPPAGTAQGPLEEVLGTLAQGRMPPEERDRMFDRMARHKVEAGLASEADDLMYDYFAEAEALIATHDDYLPPLFRDYAHSYFEAIRPGAD